MLEVFYDFSTDKWANFAGVIQKHVPWHSFKKTRFFPKSG